MKPLPRKNLAVSELAETLKRMDDKLDNLTQLFHQNNSGPELQISQETHDHTGMTISPVSTLAAVATPFSVNDNGNIGAASTPYLDTDRVREELSLSQRHSTAPQHLLSWPCSPLTLSESELHYPVSLEIERPKLSRSMEPPLYVQPFSRGSWLSQLSLSQLSVLTQFYFEHFHPSCLVLDEAKFYSQYLSHAMKTSFANDLHTCTVLFVCALGSIPAYHSGHAEWSQGEAFEAGLAFFNLAADMFRDLEGANWESVHCLLLMG